MWQKKRLGAIGVDFSSRHNPDIIHDLNIFSYPFDEESVDEVYLDNVLEHLDNPIKVMEEIYRICKPGARVKIIVPYFRSKWAFIDPTQRTFYTINSFDYYDPGKSICHRYDYTSARFIVRNIIFNESLRSGFLKRLLVRYANRQPSCYESYLSPLFPLDDISFFLERA